MLRVEFERIKCLLWGYASFGHGGILLSWPVPTSLSLIGVENFLLPVGEMVPWRHGSPFD